MQIDFWRGAINWWHFSAHASSSFIQSLNFRPSYFQHTYFAIALLLGNVSVSVTLKASYDKTRFIEFICSATTQYPFILRTQNLSYLLLIRRNGIFTTIDLILKAYLWRKKYAACNLSLFEIKYESNYLKYKDLYLTMKNFAVAWKSRPIWTLVSRFKSKLNDR